MECLKCKQNIDDDSIYCKYCGKKQIKTEKAKELKKPNGYGSIVKLNGRRRKPWAIRVTENIVDGKQVRRYISFHETKKEALEALAREQISPTSPKAKITLAELFEEWKQTKAYKDISKNTQYNYDAAYNHLSPLYQTTFNSIRSVHLERVIDGLEHNGIPLSYSSKNKVKILCGLLYKYAMQNDICNKNYAQFIKLEKGEKKEKETFTKEEIKILFENDSVENVDTILILLYTGMRINEMLPLTKNDIDIENDTITGGLKTDAGKNRVIPIHPKIKKYILTRYDKATDRLFTRDGISPITDHYYRKYIYYPLLEKLGITRKNVHCTRHTTATLLAESGADINAIKQILGHSNYAFTADTYTHVDVDFLKNALNKI